ncbi:Oxidative stress-induced growth inhibitor 2 [Blomia tropicalis]|nr:Oxidative stress-induced growth inhibitor 2 [Blomia tropicalis]
MIPNHHRRRRVCRPFSSISLSSIGMATNSTVNHHSKTECSNIMDQPRADRIESHDVLIIGNGPSAITLSFFLSGRWPYYSGHSADNPHPIEFLHNRLKSTNLSLMEQDLDHLSTGLTGRTLNRVSILFDQLQNPNTDFGHRQQSTLEWRYHPDKAIDHICLGTGLPGGLWHSLRKSKSILTVSRQKWMQLPEMDANERNCLGKCEQDTRISFGCIAQYYRDYVEHYDLSKYFRNHTRVIRVNWCAGLDCWIVDAITRTTITTNKRPIISMLSAHHTGSQWLKHLTSLTKLRSCKCQNETKWIRTRFLAKSIVLATGANSCSPSMLNIPGESSITDSSKSSTVIHSLDQLDAILRSNSYIHRPPESCHGSPIMLIVGSGLSAADACMMAANSPFRVIHIFRRSIQDRGLIFNQLSNENLYPEYNQIFRNMRQTVREAQCPNCFLDSSETIYQAYQQTSCRQIRTKPYQAVTLQIGEQQVKSTNKRLRCSKCDTAIDGKEWTIPVSVVVILIGSKPVLDFLPSTINQKLGTNSLEPLDIRSNPIRVNTITHETLASNNLYAIGPLVGDNFVRYVQGGALAVAADLYRKQKVISRIQSDNEDNCDDSDENDCCQKTIS